MPILAIFVWPILAIPLITAFFARSTGRAFWPWFAVGCILPVVSVLILLFMPELKKQENNA